MMQPRLCHPEAAQVPPVGVVRIEGSLATVDKGTPPEDHSGGQVAFRFWVHMRLDMNSEQGIAGVYLSYCFSPDR